MVQKYAKKGDKILDTHVGSASSLIAFEEAGFEYVGFEKDPIMFEKAKNRLEEYKRESLKLISLFEVKEVQDDSKV